MSTEVKRTGLPGRDTRDNGLAPQPPTPGGMVLVTGGGGYIGCVLTERLLERGYGVRILDRLYWGEEPLAPFRDRLDLVVADIRDVPATAPRHSSASWPRRPFERSNRRVRPRGQLADECRG